MKKIVGYKVLIITFFCSFWVSGASAQTFCNPLNLPVLVNPELPGRLDISDPTVVLYNNNYFLFASNVGGYWYSDDLISWKLVSGVNLPLDKMAPTAFVIDDWIYFCTSFSGTIYRSKNPVGGKWEVYTDNSKLLSLIGDFAIFVDTDSRVYCYYGCTNHDGVMVRELDPKNRLEPIGIPEVCDKINPLKSNQKKQKISAPGNENLSVSGSWMIKNNGKYYYLCTEQIGALQGHGDFVYVSDNPKGPFTFAPNNPLSYKPEGFLTGSGNGVTFEDKYGNWWHITTLKNIKSAKPVSSLGLFPAGFDDDGILFAKNDFGDYPTIVPSRKNANKTKLDHEWLLLSDNLKAEASTTLSSCPASSAFDENIETYWSSQTGNKGEWLMADLGSLCTINAFQVNFTMNKAANEVSNGSFAHQYLVEYSADKKNWKKLSDQTTNTVYTTTPYEVLQVPIQAQYIRITNYQVPAGTFAITEFRIFGTGTGRKPKKVNTFRAIRDYRNPQIVKMSWKKQSNTTGYNIRYGADKDKLYHSHQVYKGTRLTVFCPDKSKMYWFQMDAFNENGVTPGKPMLSK